LNKFLGNFNNRVAFFFTGRAGTQPPAAFTSSFKWSTVVAWADVVPVPQQILVGGVLQSFNQANVRQKKKGAVSDSF